MRSDRQGSDAWRKRPGESEIGTYCERRAWAWPNPSGGHESGYEWDTEYLAPVSVSALFGLFGGSFLLAAILREKPGYFVLAVGTVALLGLAAAQARPLRGLGLNALGIAITLALMGCAGLVAAALWNAFGAAVPGVDPFAESGVVMLLSVLIAMASSYAAWRILGMITGRDAGR